MLSVTTSVVQWQSCVVSTQTLWSVKQKIFTICLFVENSCWPLSQAMKLRARRVTLGFSLFLLCTTDRLQNHENVCVLNRHTHHNSINILCIPSLLVNVSVSLSQSSGVRFALLRKTWLCFCLLVLPCMVWLKLKISIFYIFEFLWAWFPMILCSANALVKMKTLFIYMYIKCILKVTKAFIAVS